MRPEQFEELRQYLKISVEPIFGAFVQSHHLTYATNIGPYPRLRAERTRDDGVIVWIEFWMALDPQGRYFEKFSDVIPHELSGGVSLDVREAEGIVRYLKTLALYEARPYSLAVTTLTEDLESLWEQISSWPKEAVFLGRRQVLRGL